MADPAPAPDDKRALRTLHPEDAALREAQIRRARLRLALALAVSASAAMLTAIGSWTYLAVERSLRELRTAALQSALEAQAKTLEVWIDDQMLGIRRLARDRQVRARVRDLVAIATRSGVVPEQYCAAPARRPLVEQLDEALAGSGAAAFNIVDRSGLIVASKFREYCGLRVSEAMRAGPLHAAFEGGTLFVRPSIDAERLERAPASSPLARPVLWIETPVYDEDGSVIAALGVGLLAHEQFAAILAAGRSGRTGEAYAFARNGRLLSPTRFASGARASPTLAGSVAAALAGAPGERPQALLLDPYAAYDGRAVIGAWRWLGAHELGIAIEMSAEEAYAPLHVLRAAFSVVFGALVLAVMAALFAWFSAAKLRTEIGERRRVGPYVLGERIGEGASPMSTWRATTCSSAPRP